MSSSDQWFINVQLPGKQVVRCSISASCVTCFRAEFIAEMARQRISPSGINCDWLMGDMLIGDTSPAKRQQMCSEAFHLKVLLTERRWRETTGDDAIQLCRLCAVQNKNHPARFNQQANFKAQTRWTFENGIYTMWTQLPKGCNREIQKNADKSALMVWKPCLNMLPGNCISKIALCIFLDIKLLLPFQKLVVYF